MKLKKLNIIFCSYPDFSGNAKALYEYMKDKYQTKINYVWAVSNNFEKERLNAKGIETYVIGSKEFKKYVPKVDVFFTTHCNLTKDKNEHAIYVELWHGISSKKVGFMVNNISKEDLAWYQHLSETVDYFIVPSEFWAVIFANRFHVELEQILPIGYPKLKSIKNKKAKENLLKLLDIDGKKYKKIIYYMPTFRKGCGRKGDASFGKNILNLNTYDEKKLFTYLEENQYLLCIKKHPSEESDFLNQLENKDYIKLITDDNLEKHEFELYDIFDAADLLITDYSSLGIEFLYLDKPVIYLDTDVLEYMKNRGICYDSFDFWTSSTSVRKIEDVIKLLNKYLHSKKSFPKEFSEKKKLWFHDMKDGGCETICNTFFTNNGKLTSFAKPYVNSHKKVIQLNDKIESLEEKIKYEKRVNDQKEKELQLIYQSKSWKLLEQMRATKRKISKNK